MVRPATKSMRPMAVRTKKVDKNREARCHSFREAQKPKKAATQRRTVSIIDQC